MAELQGEPARDLLPWGPLFEPGYIRRGRGWPLREEVGERHGERLSSLLSIWESNFLWKAKSEALLHTLIILLVAPSL